MDSVTEKLNHGSSLARHVTSAIKCGTFIVKPIFSRFEEKKLKITTKSTMCRYLVFHGELLVSPDVP